jgi:hypothetical protein
MSEQIFVNGARVKLSGEGLMLNSGRHHGSGVYLAPVLQRGTIISKRTRILGCEYVQWDHRRSVQCIARAFLEVIEAEPNEPR